MSIMRAKHIFAPNNTHYNDINRYLLTVAIQYMSY